MNEISITKLSSKGQVVIPLEMREDMKEGDKLLIIKNGNQIILKKASDLDEQIQTDLEFAKRTEEALKRIEKGEFISVNSENLFEEMDKW
jgi:AbrB family looped-hinge helix DNA binding protein